MAGAAGRGKLSPRSSLEPALTLSETSLRIRPPSYRTSICQLDQVAVSEQSSSGEIQGPSASRLHRGREGSASMEGPIQDKTDLGAGGGGRLCCHVESSSRCTQRDGGYQRVYSSCRHKPENPCHNTGREKCKYAGLGKRDAARRQERFVYCSIKLYTGLYGCC